MAQVIAGPGTLGGIGFYGQDEGEMLLDTALTCARGDVMMVKESAVNATSGVPDTILVPAAVSSDVGGLEAGNFCVCLEAQATAAGPVRVRFRGRVEALIVATPAIGVQMAATAAARGLTAGVAGQKIIAKMQEVGVAAALKRVDFNGIEGFGHGT